MIVDRLAHLYSTRELCVRVQCDQTAALIANIRPDIRSICRIVEGVFQIVVPLAPHETQIPHALLLRLAGIFVIVLLILRRARQRSIIVLILILMAIAVVAIVAIMVIIIVAVVVGGLHLVKKTNKFAERKQGFA